MVDFNKIEHGREREQLLISRSIWCNLKKTQQTIIACKDCQFRDNCGFRQYGAMRKVNVNFDNWITK
jgi:L-amino acid N-acyltransferase YncA